MIKWKLQVLLIVVIYLIISLTRLYLCHRMLSLAATVVLRGNKVHGPQTRGQHGDRQEERSAVVETSPAASDQRLRPFSARTEGQRWAEACRFGGLEHRLFTAFSAWTEGHRWAQAYRFSGLEHRLFTALLLLPVNIVSVYLRDLPPPSMTRRCWDHSFHLWWWRSLLSLLGCIAVPHTSEA